MKNLILTFTSLLRFTPLAAMLIVASGVAHAGSCTTVDLRAEVGPPLDQGRTGWCYAHSAALLIRQRTHQPVSAVALALDYATARPEDLATYASREHLEKIFPRGAGSDSLTFPAAFDSSRGVANFGGEEDVAILLANERGLCVERRLPSGEKEFQKQLAEMRKSYLARLKDPEFKGGSGACADSMEPSFLKSLQNSSILLVRRVIRDWVDEQCGHRKRVPPQFLHPVALRFGEDLAEFQTGLLIGRFRASDVQNQAFREIDRNFDRGRISAVGYDWCEHGEPDPDSGDCMKVRKTPQSPAPVPSIDHSAVFVARKMIGGKCHYLLQNHYGRTCEVYREEYSKAPRCDAKSGGIWLTPDEITTLHSVISIE